MAAHVLLNNIDHKDLKINTMRSDAFGDNIMYCATYYSEFRNLQDHYPILFMKSADGSQACPIALFGLEQGENLFLTEDGWDNDYVPWALEMQPFLIGFGEGTNNERQAVIHVDMDSPRISSDGVSVFLPLGGKTPYLERIADVLDMVHSGHDYNPEFMEALEKYELLEPLALDVELVDGSLNRLAGFHTINEDKLYALGGDALADLNERQFLQAIFMAVASISRFTDLIKRKNAKVLLSANDSE